MILRIILFSLFLSIHAAEIKIDKPTKIRAGILIVHGLNLNPVKMTQWKSFFFDRGFAVVSLALGGHGNGNIKEVTREIWLHEFIDAYSELVNITPKGKRFFLGHSLGGLLAVDFLANSKPLAFDQMVLLAPAIAIKPYSHLIKALSYFDNLMIPSASPKEYRANSGTSIAAYNALFKSLKAIKELDVSKIAVPTLVFVDREDELVSFTGLKSFIAKHSLSNWVIHEIHKKSEISYSHLIVDERSVGSETWSVMTAEIEKLIRDL